MRELKRYTVISATALLVSVVLLLLFPRETHTILATVLAVVFWVALIVTGFFAYSLIHNIQVRKKRGVRTVTVAQRRTNHRIMKARRRRWKGRNTNKKTNFWEETEDESD